MKARKKISFTQLEKARQLFELEETASIAQIKDVYRKLAKLYHPDMHQDDGCSQSDSYGLMQRINEAFQILMDYSYYYRISFRREDWSIQDPEDLLREQFRDDWLST